MDEATADLIFELQLQDSREIYENDQARAKSAPVLQEEVHAEDSEELQGYDHKVCRTFRLPNENDSEKSSSMSKIKKSFQSNRLLCVCSH